MEVCHTNSNPIIKLEFTFSIHDYHNEDKIEILKSDLLYGLDDKEIENKINNTDLQIYDFLKGMN